MISGAHVIMYSRDAEADREFLRDVLGLPAVDAGGGWPVFALPPSELAVHPTGGAPTHELFLMCSDLDLTLADLSAKGVPTGPVSEQRWGRLSSLTLPSGAQVSIYQPHHPPAHGEPGGT